MLAPRGPLGGPLGLFKQFLRIFEGLFGYFNEKLSKKYEKSISKIRFFENSKTP